MQRTTVFRKSTWVETFLSIATKKTKQKKKDEKNKKDQSSQKQKHYHKICFLKIALIGC